MRFSIVGCSVLCLITTLGCTEDPIRPHDLPGQYELSTAAGQPLPNLLRASETCDELLVGGTLDMRADGTFSLRLEIEEDCTRGGGTIESSVRLFEGTYILDGNELTFTVVHESDPDETFSGSVSGSAIDVVVTDLAAAGPLELRLVRSS